MRATVFFDLGNTLVVTSTRSWVASAQLVLQQLRAAGLRLGIISNTDTLTRQQLVALLPADFDFQVFIPELVILSSEVGFEKPAAAIFRLAVERAGVPAAECVFCGESLTETWAAQQVGMRAIRVLPPVASDLGELPLLLL